jgi:small subunit ribosomal protein S9
MAKKDKIVLTKAKRKTAVARARVAKGRGSVRVNSVPLSSIMPESAKREVMVPLVLAQGVMGSAFGEGLDIDVDVRGGGYMSRAEASKTAIAKGLVGWSESDDLKQAYLEYDRHLLVDDVRRKEAKKPLRSGARAKWQKSYR